MYNLDYVPPQLTAAVDQYAKEHQISRSRATEVLWFALYPSEPLPDIDTLRTKIAAGVEYYRSHIDGGIYNMIFIERAILCKYLLISKNEIASTNDVENSLDGGSSAYLRGE